jgi:DNA-binding XRE family transcriptional regulator
MEMLKSATRPQVAVFDMSELAALIERARQQMLPAFNELITDLEAAAATDEEVDFGGLLKAARCLLGLDDADMAATLNVARPTIGRWIRGISSPHPLTRKAICAALIKTARGKVRLLQD